MLAFGSRLSAVIRVCCLAYHAYRNSPDHYRDLLSVAIRFIIAMSLVYRVREWNFCHDFEPDVTDTDFATEEDADIYVARIARWSEAYEVSLVDVA